MAQSEEETAPGTRVIEASFTASAVGSVGFSAEVRRGAQAWTYIYTLLGFALTIETGIVSIIDPLHWLMKVTVLIALYLITSALFLSSGWFQNLLFRIKEYYENKFR